jgi:Spy/CpxP family protein refolding chaperone
MNHMPMNTLLKTGIVAVALGASGAGLWYLRAAPPPPTSAAAAPAAPAAVPEWFPRAVRFLHLTPDQRAQLAKIRESRRTAVAAIRRDASLNADQKRAKIRDEVRSGLAEAGQVLTPEQHAQLERIRRRVMRDGWRDFAMQLELRHERNFWGRMDHRPPMPGMRPYGPAQGGRPGGDRAMAMAGRRGPGWAGGPGIGPGRNLTPEQRAKIAELTKTYREQVRAILATP